MVDRYTIAWRIMLVLLWDTCHKMFYKNNTDFKIANWAKRSIKIFTIKTHYTVYVNHHCGIKCLKLYIINNHQ